jgi:hypothetical protein
VELETAARRHLLADDTCKGYVSGRVYKYRLEEKVDGTGKTALVVSRNNGWATPDPIGSCEYPILRVDCYADPTRDDTGEIRKLDALDKAYAVARAVKRAFYWPHRGRFMGGVGSDLGLMVMSIAPRSEPYATTRSDMHGGGRTIVESLGDSVYVTVEFNLTTIH